MLNLGSREEQEISGKIKMIVEVIFFIVMSDWGVENKSNI